MSSSPTDISTGSQADEAVRRLGFLLSFPLVGVAATWLVFSVCSQWNDEENLRWSQALVASQMDQLKRGEIHCLVQPDPRFMNDILADAKVVGNIREIYLGGDVSDQRLGRLRELPNFTCVVLLFANNSDVFLERLRGATTIEEATLEDSGLSRRGVASINTFPRLRSLSLGVDVADLEAIKNKGSIENLAIRGVKCDERLLAILKSLPRLRTVNIDDPEGEATACEALLRRALPNCQCSVRVTR